MINKDNKIKTITCPICGETMIEFEYGYDNKVFGKIYFKCDCCGHKESRIL